jgi:hypothetical protein
MALATADLALENSTPICLEESLLEEFSRSKELLARATGINAGLYARDGLV